MAHKTMIDGVAYEITGGKTFVDGTAYSIKSGKTLIGGTVYEVGFAKPTVKIWLPQGEYASLSAKCQLTLSEFVSKHDEGTVTVYEVAVGTLLHCKLTRTAYKNIRVYVNGICVGEDEYSETNTEQATLEYTHTITKDTAVFIGGDTSFTAAHISEGGDDPVTVTITSDDAGGKTYLEIGGSEYYENQVLEVPAGTVITCYNRGDTRLNSITVSQDYSGSHYWYYIATKNCVISLSESSSSGHLYITEE